MIARQQISAMPRFEKDCSKGPSPPNLEILDRFWKFCRKGLGKPPDPPRPGAWTATRSVQFSIYEQLLRRSVKRFRGGLVFKAHRLLYHTTRLERNEEGKDTNTSTFSTEGGGTLGR